MFPLQCAFSSYQCLLEAVSPLESPFPASSTVEALPFLSPTHGRFPHKRESRDFSLFPRQGRLGVCNFLIPKGEKTQKI